MTIAGLRGVKLQLEATATGLSEELDVPFGQHLLFFRATNWTGTSCALQILENGVAYPYIGADGNAVVVTSQRYIPIHGGQKYRLNVTGIAAAATITVTAKATTRGLSN